MTPSNATTGRQTALVTGASSGIGEALAKVLAREGYDLVLVARRKSALEALAEELMRAHGATVAVHAMDLSEPFGPKRLQEDLQRDGVTVDVLVNNAGFGSHGVFAETDISGQLNMIQLNVSALTELTHLFMQGMIERRRGRIMNVASTGSFQAGPLMAVYYATKAYVLSFSEAIRNELKGTGVTVTALCPGPTHSGFQERADLAGMRLLSANMMMSSEQVAELGYRGMVKGRSIVVTGWMNLLGVWIVKFSPRAWVVPVVRKVMEKR